MMNAKSSAGADRKGTEAKGMKLPEADVNRVIGYAWELMNGAKLNEVAEEVKKDYGPRVKKYIQNYAETSINDYLKNSDQKVLQNLGDNGFARVLVKSSPKVFTVMKAFFKNEIGEEKLVELLGQTGIKDVGVKLMDACGIDPSKMVSDPQILMKLSSPIIAYQASMAAYKEYRKAMDDLQLAREERLETEARCQETIACIREYRRLMEERVSEYLGLRLDTMTDGFAAMDKAIMENDMDGYISGNVEIQKMLGYDVQFTNQEEFDELMDSDEDFIL